MFRRAVMILLLPLSGLIAQSRATLITISNASGGTYGVVQYVKDSVSHIDMHIGGRLNVSLRNDESIAVVSEDSSSRFRVEAAQDNRTVASAEGRFIVIRQNSDNVSIEARNRGPLSTAPTDLRKP